MLGNFPKLIEDDKGVLYIFGITLQGITYFGKIYESKFKDSPLTEMVKIEQDLIKAWEAGNNNKLPSKIRFEYYNENKFNVWYE